jgi:AraC-like DNA-binding protein
MARARTLLLETELSITQIALEVGYEYAGNFTTAFKRYFGVPPNVMRKGK